MENVPKKDQKIALVTGVGVGGIGGALVTELHSAGYFVICAARNPDKIQPLIKEPSMLALSLDVTVPSSVTSLAEKVAALTERRLDVLINNAGSAVHIPALDLDVDGVVKEMFDINVLGPMRMVKEFSSLLINAKGTIINIGSVAPIIPLPFSAAYNSTKAALHAYGDSLRMELSPLGVQVVTVIAGSVKSNIVKDSNPPLPHGSRYAGVKKFWLKRVNLSQNAPMSTELFARDVVKVLSLKNKPVWYWRGYAATLTWFLYYFFPKSWRVFFMMRSYGLFKM